MKKLFSLWVLLLSLTLSFTGCQDEYDDTSIRKDIENIQGEIEAIKADLATLKGQVTSIQTLVDAHKGGKVVTQIEELPEGKGYRITFNDATTIEVLKYTSEEPAKGSVIGVQEWEGAFYWTIITDGNSAFLLNEKGEKIAVSGAKEELTLDEMGYWTLNGKRIVDANEDFIRFKKGDSTALFKDIVVSDDKITFILSDDSEIVVNKKTETFIRFESNFQLINKGRPNKLKFNVSSDLQGLEVTKAPAGWSVNIHRPEKYVGVSPSNDASFGLEEIRIEGYDANGLVYATTIKVGIKGSGFDNEQGVFILNEGNMTTENGSLIYIDGKGVIGDYIYQAMNGSALGNATQDLFIHNNKMYIISQNGTKNAVGTLFKNDGMLVVANSKTLKKEAAFNDELQELSWPTHIAVLDEEHIYIRDNNGVHCFNSASKNLTLIEGTAGAAKNRMAVAGNKVFFIQNNKLSVIEKGQNKVSKSIDMGASITGIIRSADGNLFVATNGNPGKISKINSSNYEVIKSNEVTEGSLSAGMGATPSITAIGNLLYYSGAGTVIYRHNFETGESKRMIDAKDVVNNSNMVYNNIAVHPMTGRVYMNTIKGYGWDFTINNISVFKPEGDALVLEKNYEDHTRFPAGIFFPANFK